MIYFGINGSGMAPAMLEELDCPHCGQRSLYAQIIHRYVHIWFVPFFPVGTTSVARCVACHRMWREEEMGPFMSGRVEDLKEAGLSAPKHLFAGLYLIGLFIIAVMCVNRKHEKNTAAYIDDPHRNDLYVIRTDRDELYPNIIMEVQGVRGDSVEMMIGGYGYQLPMDAAGAIAEGALDRPGYFVESATFSRDHLARLYRMRKIPRIIRQSDE